MAEFGRREALLLGVGGAALAARPVWALQSAPPADPVDAIVAEFQRAFEIPGVAVALIRPQQPVFIRGYGIRTLGRSDAVDVDTQFAIASNTKAFTAAALAILVEEGKLSWDEPVRRYMPDFRMSDETVTEQMTVRDLLVHRSGLALGAGDLMRFPETDLTLAEVLQGLGRLPLSRGFRSGYAYDNVLYLVAGALIERVGGVSYETFLTTRLLRPLGMPNAVASQALVRGDNVAGRHARLGPPVRGFGALERIQPREWSAMPSAGGVHASVREIAPWLRTQLARGVTPDGLRLWSQAQADEMSKPQVIRASGPGPTPEFPMRSVMTGYALGWTVQEYRDRRMIHHSGSVSGQLTYTGFFPDSGHAYAVFTNTEDGVGDALSFAIADHLIGAAAFDWVGATRARNARQRATALGNAGGDFNRPPAGGPSLPLAAYAGRYRDPWYGDIGVAVRDGVLHIDFTRTPVLKSALEPFGVDTFRTRFPRGAAEDAVVTFVVESGRPVRLKLRALSPFADFSYDFHDLNPVRTP
jgi:CubicO group peptidase (beta-lactamase class C family)